MKIQSNMLISELIEKDANIADVLIKHGMNCLGCPASATESLEEAARGHSANIEEIIQDIEKYFKEKA